MRTTGGDSGAKEIRMDGAGKSKRERCSRVSEALATRRFGRFFCAGRMISHRCPFFETRIPHSYMFTRFSADCQPVENVSPCPSGTQMRVISLLSHPRPIGRPRVFDHTLGKAHFDEITASQGENANLRRERTNTS